MNFDFFYASFLKQLTINLPALILLIVCAALTFTFWQRHPPAARRLMFALIWMIGADLLAIAWHSFGFFLMFPDRHRGDETPFLLSLSAMEGLGYVWFLLAVNAARVPYRSDSFYDDEFSHEPLQSESNLRTDRGDTEIIAQPSEPPPPT